MNLSNAGASLATENRTMGRRKVWLWTLALTGGSLLFWPAFWSQLTSTRFLPHGYCYLWNSKLLWVNITTDILIWLSYVIISATLVSLAFKARRDIPFQWVYLAFGAFIVACGFTHFMEVIVIWKPVYWMSAAVKIITAIASVATAIVIPPLVPKTVALLETARMSSEHKVQMESLKGRFLAQKAANMGSWEWNMKTGEMVWSEEMFSMSGMPPSAKPSFDGWMSQLGSDERERIKAEIANAIKERREVDTEFSMLRPDGAAHWIAIRGQASFDEHGQPKNMIGIAMDVSRSKQAEEALRKSEKLAAAGRISATIAHEINNPLAAVTNLLYLARKKDNLEATRKYIEAANEELKRVTHIAKQTLGFFREHSQPVRFSVTGVMDDLLMLYNTKIDARQLKLEKDYQFADEIEGFEAEFRQVVSNLLSNAIEASPTGAKLRVRVSSVEKDMRQTIRIDVQDFGEGINQENLDKIFQPFFTTKQDVGTGLGLWVAKDLISKQGGSIEVVTETKKPDNGTTFSVLVPLLFLTSSSSPVAPQPLEN